MCYYNIWKNYWIRQLAYEFAECNEIPHNFDRNTKTVGFDWLSGFLKRNNEILMTTQEMISLQGCRVSIHLLRNHTRNNETPK